MVSVPYKGFGLNVFFTSTASNPLPDIHIVASGLFLVETKNSIHQTAPIKR